MISDPLKITNHEFYSKKLLSWLKEHPEELCFFDHQRKTGERWVGVVDSDQSELWWIDVVNKTFTTCGPGQDQIRDDRESFFEFLKVEYPDHLEWLLFHPEPF